MSDAVSTTHAKSDGTVTVTLAAGLCGEDWKAAVDEMRATYPGRYIHWWLDAEGRDVFTFAAAAVVAPLPCSLCAAGQPHGHGHGRGSYA
ncbi:MAG TPA: hypothetical protein VIL68_05930 [Propionibacteriaceae bacterium]